MSLRDGTAKMSKSDPSDQSRINLLDDADTIAKKFKRAKSDADLLPATVEELAGRPEAANLIAIYAALADVTKAQALERFAGKGFGALKPELAEVAVSALAPVTAEMARLMADPTEIDRVLARRGRARPRRRRAGDRAGEGHRRVLASIGALAPSLPYAQRGGVRRSRDGAARERGKGRRSGSFRSPAARGLSTASRSPSPCFA